MKLFVLTTLALASLAAPLASASAESANPCIVYPITWAVGGYWVTTPGATVPGQDVFFVHTDPIHVTSGSVWVPYVTTITTPGICYGPVVDFIENLLSNVKA